MTPDTGRPHDDGWMADAKCRDQPVTWFTDPAGPAETRAALATCNGCPVRQTCLNTALALAPDEDIGIWGGTTIPDRQLLRIGQQPPPPPVEQRHARPRPTSGRQHPAPRVTVAQDDHGDFTDASQRVTVTRLAARDYVLIVDGHVTARVPRLTDAQEIAWRTLHAPQRPRDGTSADRTDVTRAVSR